MANITKSNTAISATSDKLSFTPEQVELIRSQIAPKATPDELKLFLYQAQRTGLDPLARQIYCIHLAGKMTIQTSIDGFRVVAERSGDYAGQSEPEFMENEQGIVCCRITVFRFRGDIRYPAAVGVAYWNEYNVGNHMWKKLPHTMIAKCAEALALRKAYPQDLSGLYTGDEMQQADNQPTQGKQAVTAQPTPPQETHEYTEAEEVHAPDYGMWQETINGASTLDELGAIYRANAAIIKADPNLLDMFGARKQSFSKTV